VLDGAPQVLSLPADRPRRPVQRHRGARLAQEVSREVVEAVHALARESGCTPFMALLAAFQTLLARYGGDEELLIGTPVAGRGRTELEGLVGFFVNTLVMRGDLRGNPSFRELLARVKRTALDAYSNADVPFERIVDELKPRRDPGRTPLFQVMFNLHSEPAAEPAFEGLRATRIAVARHTSKVDLSVSLLGHAGGLSATFEYDTDLFDRETIAEMAESYATLLGEVARDAGKRIGDYALLGARVAPPGPVFEPFPERTLADRFAAQVAAHGERPAVVSPDATWTYAELGARARAIGRRVAASAPDGPVALLLGHDAVMIAGLLGAVHARRSWVPLDPYAPEPRNRRILEDSGATVIVTDASRDARFGSNLPRVLIGREKPEPFLPVCQTSTGNERPAYLLYTSGTTGAPKAVVQSERGVLGQIRSWTSQLGLGPADRLTLFSGYGYDAAVQDIFGALLNGASLHPMDLRGGESAPELVDRIAGEGVTVIHATPTVYRHLFGGRVTCAQDLSHVRLVVLGGEEARRSDLDLFKLRFARGARFVNGLGLTESTMGLQYFADHDTRVLGDRLPVGRPVPGTDAFLLGDAWQGELVLESDHLALGYHGDAALTAERFPQPRRLLTRDRLRRLPDGQFVHAGRLDRQLKIRGIRIEPAEIEAALRNRAGITDAVVLPSADGTAAFVAGAAGDVAAIRSELRAQLPEAMIPAHIVAMSRLPRLANGKLDRAALDAHAAATTEPRHAGPGTLAEARVAAIWRELLGCAEVRPDDDFFALGGHSLLATRLVARVHERLGVDVALAAVFAHPVLRAFAAHLEGLGEAGAIPAPIRRLRRRRDGA
jgi:amino acid adenylation domain-containing protein